MQTRNSWDIVTDCSWYIQYLFEIELENSNITLGEYCHNNPCEQAEADITRLMAQYGIGPHDITGSIIAVGDKVAIAVAAGGSHVGGGILAICEVTAVISHNKIKVRILHHSDMDRVGKQATFQYPQRMYKI